MFETIPQERALLVVVFQEREKEDWSRKEITEEFRKLVLSTGIEVKGIVFVKIKQPSSSLYIGNGKAIEIAQIAQEKDANVVIFNNNLSYTQQKNLEEILGVKVIDRTQLILDIFAKHAHSQEGALQVELAQLEYLLPRLKGKGIMLSRLGGGIGTRGPGEKKLEVDKRRISDRIIKLKKELNQVRKHRKVIRKKREKEQLYICSLVGYTNAGKTTLFNALVGDTQLTADSFFTTLDPVSRTIVFPNNLKMVITDTVGFLYKLPHNLVEAFGATLEELKFADLLLHVADASNKSLPKLIEAVSSILKNLGLAEKKILLVLNKIDKISEEEQNRLVKEYPEAVPISAHKRINLNVLLERIYNILSPEIVEIVVKFPFHSMEILDYLYTHSEVVKVEFKEEVIALVRIIKNYLPFLKNKGAKCKEILKNDTIKR